VSIAKDEDGKRRRKERVAEVKKKGAQTSENEDRQNDERSPVTIGISVEELSKYCQVPKNCELDWRQADSCLGTVPAKGATLIVDWPDRLCYGNKAPGSSPATFWF